LADRRANTIMVIKVYADVNNYDLII